MLNIGSLEITRRFRKSYRELDSRGQWHCSRSLRFLLEEPGHPVLDARPILPERVYWEGRAGPHHRILFRPEGGTAYVLDLLETES